MKHETPYLDMYLAEKTRREELEEELRQLKAQGAVAVWPLRLTQTEQAYIGRLLRAPIGAPVSKDALMDAAGSYADRDERKIVDVIVCRLRPKLEPLGVLIDTVWGQGYTIGKASREAWKRACDALNDETESGKEDA